MAGNKLNPKTKVKEDKSKTKCLPQNLEDNEEADFSVLRKPILTSITGFAQARKIFDVATEELKGLISNECDILYECKVCRNLFRSLANFISHKRVYCTEQFNTDLHGHFFKVNSTANEITKIKKLEEQYFESLKEKEKIEVVHANDSDNRIPMTRDLTTIIEKIAKSKQRHENISDEQQLVFQKIPNSSVAIFQNLDSANEQDKMGTQVKELDTILSTDKAVLQSDGKFKIQSYVPSDMDNIIQISDDEDNDGTKVLKCKICDLNFSTLKTLKFHMKYKHLESRLVYSCPDCLEIFSTSWSVYRHLFKVHRKTAAQIRRLRESIQAKAFKMDNPPAFYEKRKNMKPPTAQKLSEEERLDQENQAWMDNVEGDSEVPRCFGCGRTFERRAALAAHTHTCQPRSRALARRPERETKKIEIQIRKDYNKASVPSLTVPPKTVDSSENKAANEDIPSGNKSSQETELLKTTKETKKTFPNDILKELSMDIAEILEKPNDSPEKPSESQTPVLSEASKPVLKLPFAQHIEKNNFNTFRQKIQADIEENKLLCKKCDIQYESMQELYSHMASHYKWMRYACKLCNFKNYDLEKLPEHVKVVHKLRGDSEFYHSTVKAIDGNEALELSECVDERANLNEVSPDSRRQSRCSSDSSRVSDDSSSSSTRVETGARKRKLTPPKGSGKRKREVLTNDGDNDQKSKDLERETNSMMESDSPSKTIEENSSDLDDVEDKLSKRFSTESSSSVASRRPVRKKTKPKNEDFEYDLSNLLKMEAQGYRDSQTITTKSNQTKKKPNSLDTQNNYEIANRDCSGALATLSKKAVEKSTAHLKNHNFIPIIIPKESKPCNIFVRPMLPKILLRGDKSSPKKEEIKNTAKDADENPNGKNEVNINKPINEDSSTNQNETVVKDTTTGALNSSESTFKGETTNSKPTTQPNIPPVVPIKFRRQSLEVIKNPLINKNINDFKKAGMKTKILVIKPINRNKDGTTVAKPLKFQTIKLKDPSKSSTGTDESCSDPVVVVKVPQVDCKLSVLKSDDIIVDTEKSCSSVNDSAATIDTKISGDLVKPKATDTNMEKDNVEGITEDFEYDLSNLLNMEAQENWDSQTLSTEFNQTKKKPNSLNISNKYEIANRDYSGALANISNKYEIANRDYSGALATLSKKAVEKYTGHLKSSNFIPSNIAKESKPCNIVTPMVPKITVRDHKNSPKKDEIKNLAKQNHKNSNDEKESKINIPTNEDSSTNQNRTIDKDPITTQLDSSENICKNKTTESEPTTNIPLSVPIKLRRQSLEVIKNPLIHININDLKIPCRNTKILSVQPINKNRHGITVAKPLKFKDPSIYPTVTEDSFEKFVETINSSSSAKESATTAGTETSENLAKLNARTNRPKSRY